MKQFAETYGFNHVTTSPYYPQAPMAKHNVQLKVY